MREAALNQGRALRFRLRDRFAHDADEEFGVADGDLPPNAADGPADPAQFCVATFVLEAHAWSKVDSAVDLEVQQEGRVGEVHLGDESVSVIGKELVLTGRLAEPELTQQTQCCEFAVGLGDVIVLGERGDVLAQPADPWPALRACVATHSIKSCHVTSSCSIALLTTDLSPSPRNHRALSSSVRATGVTGTPLTSVGSHRSRSVLVRTSAFALR